MIFRLFGSIHRKYRDGLEIIHDTLNALHSSSMFNTPQVDGQDPVGKLNGDIGIDPRVVLSTITYEDKFQVGVGLQNVKDLFLFMWLFRF